MQLPSVVLDIGTGMSKLGFSGDGAPTVLHSLVGRDNQKKVFYGDEAYKKKPSLKYNDLFEEGVMKNWDDLELFWEYIFSSKLKLEPSESSVFFTDVALNPKAKREKLTEIMMEKYLTQQFYIHGTSLLSLYASGRQTGVVIESGQGVTHVVPFCDAHQIKWPSRRFQEGGYSVTKKLKELLVAKERVKKKLSEEVLRDIKETLCEVKQSDKWSKKKMR